jgi:antibiotic biosynthesis monooxygenase (ABM) superfamily enzyme
MSSDTPCSNADAADGASPPVPVPPPPSAHLRVLITWLAVYPSILVVQALLDPFMNGASGPVRLLAVTAVVVPVVVYVFMPLLLKLRAGLLRLRRRER